MPHRTLDYIDYGDEYRVGIKDMDIQHERLFTVYNEFVDRYNKAPNQPLADVRKIFNDMFWYTRYHFREEEWILRTYNYPNAREHVEKHKAIIDALTKISTSSTDIDSMVTALDTFIEIWATHILENDRQYGRFIENY
jgi:hemerythrin